ncbi:Serine/threonine-protein kinase 19, partial [Gamsiella multidivaricata]
MNPAALNLNDTLEYPADTYGAIYYLLALLRPHKIRQQKAFPRVCMIHQLYSIIKDHTTVDRALAQLIKDNTIRKFYLGGTGSDEFAIMLTSDYVVQIQQAKEQYLKDLQTSPHQQQRGSGVETATSSAKRRNLDTASDLQTLVAHKRIATGPSTTGPGTGPIIARIPGSKMIANKKTTDMIQQSASAQETQAGEIFERFKDLVMSGQCLEISIQHSNIQSVIDATDQDITILIRYSLLNRSLSQPANPHLVNLNQPAGRGGNTGGSGASTGNSSSGHSALNQLIHATNQEQAKTIKSESTSSSTSGSAVSSSPGAAAAATTTITANLGRRQHVSDDVAYRFAIRQGGLFVTHFLKGRLEILRMIKRQIFGDMLVS